MRRTSPLRRVGIVVAGAAVLFFIAAAGLGWAGVVGSKHDFSQARNLNGQALDRGGVCTPCHSPHYAPATPGIWARDMGDEESYFNQTSSPRYVSPPTRLCYDCHDNHQTADVDDNPLDSVFDTARRPQDVAFDDDMRNPLPANDPRDGSDSDGKPGYYENIPSGTVPPASTYISGHYVKNDPNAGTIAQGDKLPCSDCHDPHSSVNQAFIRADLGGKSLSGKRASNFMAYTYTEAPAGRDDLASRDFCIACHGTSEQATYRAVTFDDINPSYGSATIAAPSTRITAHRAGRVTACTKCHKHNGISVSCEDCHGFPPLRTYAQAGNQYFNKDVPALRDVENYLGGAGAHQRHLDALGATIFQCEICHGPDPGSAAWHNQGAGVIADGGNINIMGLGTYWAPSVYPGSITPAYSGGGAGPSPGDAAFVFSSMGGGQQRCTGVACHGNPLSSESAQLNWDDDMIDGDVPEPAKAGEIQICKWCHDATPAMIFFGADPYGAERTNPSFFATGANAMGNGLTTVAGFGAEVNGHGVGLAGAVKAVYDRDAVNDAAGAAGAAKECTVCHDAAYIAAPPPNHPQRTHFPSIHDAATDPRDEKRLRDTINSATPNIGTSATFPTGPDQACSACHQNGSDADGADWSYHGNNFADKREGDFTRACRQCHDVHGSNWNGTGRNLYMIGKWIDDGDRTPDAGDGAYVDSTTDGPADSLAGITSADRAVVFTSRTGANSFDEDDGAYNPAADTDDICAACHAAAPTAAPYNGTGTGGGSHAGVAGTPPDYLTPGMTDERGKDCTMCHEHDFDKPKNYATNDAFMPSGCSGCHGNSSLNQFWPDGTPSSYPYADNNAGAHQNHILTISQRVFGQTIAQLLADANTIEKQKQICRYCHPDPGGPGHTTDSGDSRVDIVAAGAFGRFTVGAEPVPPAAPTADTGSLAYTPGAVTEGTCNNLVCHNQAASPPFWNNPPVWVALPPNAQCSNVSCHAAGSYSNAHAAHAVSRTEGTGAGSGYLCTECHVDNGVNLQHQNGEVDMLFTNAGSLDVTRGGATVAYYDKDNSGAASPTDTGFAYKDATSGYAHACNNVYCHGADSTWGGADTTPVWNDPGTATCYEASTCHNAYGGPYDQYGSPRYAIATGSHSVHLTQWTSVAGVEVTTPLPPRGPRLAAHPNTLAGSTQPNCSVCHNMLMPPGGASCTYCHGGTASGASLPTPTHADGRVDFIGVINAPDDITAESFANTTVCDACHGGATPAAAAKTNWNTPAWRAPCEDCHGDYTASRSRPNIGYPPRASVDAPLRAGTNFDGSGHGKTGVAKTCQDCHNETSQHFTQRDGDGVATIAPALGDTNRLDLQGGNDYAVAPVTYCGICHSGAVETIHFPNTNTAGGTSNDAILCSACHDPHGQAGQDAMIVGSVVTDPQPPPRTISGFTDKTARASYANSTGTPFQGVCQACHDAVEVTTFNRATDSSATHQPGALCTSCHLHTNTVAFTAHCYDCHGDTAGGTHYYPDTASALPAAWPDRAGRHVAHVAAIANFSGVDSVVDTDASTCGWCHPGGGHSGDQAAVPADLMNGTATHFLTINSLIDTNEVVTQDGGAATVTCAGVNCHYNKEMPAADWYGAPVVNCDYCHADGVAAYTLGALPNAHNVHVDEAADGGRDFLCTQCHPTQVSDSHQNGTVEIVFSPTNTLGEPGVTPATQSGSDLAVKYGQTGGGFAYATCNALFCHGADTYEDAVGFQLAGGTLTAPNWAVATDGDCGTCHDTGTQSGETSSGTSIASGNHAAHLTAAYGPNFDETVLASSCDQCHPAYTTAPYRITHVAGTTSFLNLDNTTVTTLALTTTCDECHGASTANAKTPANWADNTTPYLLPCIECHDTTNPANSARAGSGVDAPAKDATQWTGRGHGNTATYPWGTGRAGANSACGDCHNVASAHLSGSLADSDRLSTSGNALCNVCHDGGGAGAATTSVSTHGNTATMTPTYTAQRSPFELNCVECHDVHGTANIYMVNAVNPNGPLVATRTYNGSENLATFLYRGTVAFTDHSVGTSATSGIGFADTNALGNASKICQTCHTATVHFQYNSTDTHFNSICVGCHPHEFDSNNTTADGFMPKGDCKDCHDAAASNPPALAPKVMANWTTSGHGKAGIAAECTDCHTLSLPVPDTHADDTVNSVWENGTVTTRNTNTAHLRGEYFTPPTPPPTVPVGSGAWDTQVIFDNRCWTQCHETAGALNHRHEQDTTSSDSNHWSMGFGEHFTYADGDRGSVIWPPSSWILSPSSDPANAPYPIDCDLSTNADCSGTNYAPCISCHDPHGTNVVETGEFSNYMLRRKWKGTDTGSYLCRGCHP